MALFRKRINIRSEINTGFGINSENSGGRFVNKDGKPNVEKRGIPILEKYSWYHTMLSLPRWKFFLFIFLVFLAINFLFANIYYFIGFSEFGGVTSDKPVDRFAEEFFFSVQTLTTVGYGRVNPVGFLSGSVASFESFLGVIAFALATGLFYGRFSKPRAYLKFSDVALIAPYKDGTALMFRLAPYKNNYLTDAEVKITLAMKEEVNGKWMNRFFSLDLEITKVNALSLSWTIVHPIDEKSPLYGFTEDNFKNNDLELLVFVKAFDEDYSNTVVARTSYINSEIIYGGKFKLMYHPDTKKQKTLLQINLLNEFEKVPLPTSPFPS